VTSAFLDTNVLLYLLSGDQAKANTAETLLARGGTISVQVLNEFAHVARRKFRAHWVAVHDSLTAIRANLATQPITVETHELGLRLSERYILSVFDGQLLAAAVLANCDLFYSEDMQDGQVIEGLTIRNPFLQR
jgi:predicted nucleic acid-binding protein